MPEQELGVVLIVVGAVLMVFGVFFGPVCGLGLVLLIIGIVLAATSRPTPQYYYPQPAYAPPAPGAPGAPAAGAPFQAPGCYVCGTALTWVPQYGRWYCYRCQSYR